MWVLAFLLSSVGIILSAQMLTDGADLSALMTNGIIFWSIVLDLADQISSRLTQGQENFSSEFHS